MKTRAILLALLLVAGCSGGSTQRPISTARLAILSPTVNEQTGTSVDLRVELTGATVVPASQVKGALRGDQGHIHVTVDGRLVSMAFGLTQTVPGLTPGPHSIQAEFVAVDHLPFRNRVLASPVLFTVKA